MRIDFKTKVLFATETFAMGVNMPAHSVIFPQTKKHDGVSMRYLLPSEYTQMAGRAGRRGTDVAGFVYLMAANELPEKVEFCGMLLSKRYFVLSEMRTLRKACSTLSQCTQSRRLET